MCGIAGFAGQGTRDDLQRMTDALAHRGPDGEGRYVAPELGVFLGHRRLSILDLDGGHQPMWNEDGQIGVVFNGEIYNHAELRADLVRLGHRFATDHSDTEVLVHGWEEWGEALPARLNGMFAFAILDRNRRRLFLARDRFGEKPLYYTDNAAVFAFASELSALAEHPAVDRTISLPALRKLFAYGYIPAPHAFLRGCRKLPAGHSLSHDLAMRRTRIECYWRFALEPDEALNDRDEPRLVEELRHLLVEAARRRLISDVPLGLFLSGGVDSSAVLAAVAQTVPADRIQTFAIGFREASFDESRYASQVAAHFGTRHRQRILDIEAARDMIPHVLARMDEPLGDASILPTFLLARFVRERVTVALSGDAGDELFAGYDPFAALKPAAIYSRLVPRFLHSGFRALAELLPRSHRNLSLDFKIRRTLMGLSYSADMRLPVWMAPLEPAELREFLRDPVDPREVYSEAIERWEAARGRDDVDRAMEFFTVFYLQDDILMKVDRAAMMSSLESRAVFLDNDLVDFCRRLPNRFKFRAGTRKYLLKKAVRDMLPPGIVERGKKGFGIPLSKWLETVPAEPPVSDIAGIGGAYAARAWADHRSGRADHRLFLWSWLTAHFAAQRYRSRHHLPPPGSGP